MIDTKAIIEAMALMVEVEGMKAANSKRTSNGYTLAYDESDFYHEAERMRKILKDKEPGQ